jgi:hypothetical protein
MVGTREELTEIVLNLPEKIRGKVLVAEDSNGRFVLKTKKEHLPCTIKGDLIIRFTNQQSRLEDESFLEYKIRQRSIKRTKRITYPFYVAKPDPTKKGIPYNKSKLNKDGSK